MSYKEAKIIMPKLSGNGESYSAIHEELTRTLKDNFLTVIKTPVTMVALDPRDRMVYESGVVYSVYAVGGGEHQRLFTEIVKTYVARLNLEFILAANFGGSLNFVERG